MTRIYSTLRAGVMALKDRAALSMAQMMDGARIGDQPINARYLAKLSSGSTSSRALAVLHHLVQRHGASPEELLVPALQTTSDTYSAASRRPSSPYHMRTSQGEFVEGLKQRKHRIDNIDDPICQVLTVFERPAPDDRALKVLAVGRSTVLAIEAGLNSPRALEDALAHSPTDATRPLLKAAARIEPGQSITASRTMAVYVPPDVLVTCALVTYIQRIEFLGLDAVGHYAAAPAVSRSRKPEDPELSGDYARILSATEFPLPL